MSMSLDVCLIELFLLLFSVVKTDNLGSRLNCCLSGYARFEIDILRRRSLSFKLYAYKV